METKEKTFTELLCETKVNLMGLQFVNKIQEEIDQVGECSCCNSEYNYLECQAYINGLKEAVKIFQQIKNQQ